ncbi:MULTISPECIES: DNA-deoxyinosine glycosylase [Burkholderia]|uniref:DNA-deoxyinosine glycosylase n=1 Tax=Burkholderia TaxID=32008 RepID=UPI00075C6170|nr:MULTISPECIES: DNA-deoxyinosine glycosylase [Burkholderia]AOJ70885.1 DNA-deoxyinosine glycosylase [Burkholderia savannae]AOJ82659.1 DNA-deoxyinosine glycosylase [Burkholderia savannae]KVG44540.1 DNA-deoxyinosine glycosylase [Burkholderia sp. MSMB0265]KVG82840.1 DNA-deoxyinosine glycosylase [Burkholderia sp. MSMB2040]KVH00548.1 DNA-deoxyinosine glycosylase [Burkholderia sp. MSMB2041]
MLRGFPPVVAPGTHTLILGSFPGEASLVAAQYYAHPRNQFWRLLGAALGEPALHELPYDARLARVLAHGFGIWDVLAACHREGSLDSAIRHAKPNDFDSLREVVPSLKKVCFNGKTAGRFEAIIRAAGFDTLVLPSSSPANATLSFDQKLIIWKGIVA